MVPRHPLIRPRPLLALSGGRSPETKRPLQLLLLFSLLLFGCRPATAPPPTPDQTQTAPDAAVASASVAATATEIPDQVKELRNGQYQLGATDPLRVVQLTDGKFEQGTPGSDDFISVKMTDFVAVGDLNADGTDEVAALVSENYGGSGVFVFLAVYTSVDGKLTFQASTMVDDRPQLNALSIKGGEISLDIVIHAPDDPMCCPTLRTVRHYRFVDNQLDLADYATFAPGGRPRTIKIESPEDGTQVYSSIAVKGSVAIAPSGNHLTYRIADVSGIELSAGQIPVTASEPGGPGTFNAVISLGKVLSGAVIQIEVQDVSPADGSLLAMDSAEIVVK